MKLLLAAYTHSVETKELVKSIFRKYKHKENGFKIERFNAHLIRGVWFRAEFESEDDLNNCKNEFFDCGIETTQNFD